MKQIKEKYINEIDIQKSKFIAVILPIYDKNSVKNEIDNLKKNYPKAAHYCYGYIINGIQKSNDDGEPSSTAGKPILENLIINQLNNVLLVVIRYFGGIKLGAGGLTRAYVDSSSKVIQKATFYQETQVDIYQIKCSYNQINILKNYLFEIGAQILKTEYNEDVDFYISINKFNENELINFMQGKIKITFIESKIELIKL
ncbi:MAG: YigZ family protein [Bacilli bacterium]